jgi:hypothetical protein
MTLHLRHQVDVSLDRRGAIRRRDFLRGITAASIAAGTLSWRDLVKLVHSRLEESRVAIRNIRRDLMKDLREFELTIGYLRQRLEQQSGNWPEYSRYYQAQALFQGDVDAWEKWNKLLIRQLKQMQQPNGSFRGQMGGPSIDTAMSLLALALNYRFLPIYER